MCLPKSSETPVSRHQPMDKCQFFGSSNIDNIEVERATQLEISHNEYEIIKITVRKRTANSGFMLKIGKIEGVKCVIFMTLDSQEKSVNVLDDSTNISVYAGYHFKRLLEQHQETIEKLDMHAKFFEDNYDFGIKQLRNLKELAVESRFLLQFLPKLRYPLDLLKLYGKAPHARFEMMLKVHLRTSSLTRFHAPQIDCDFDQLTQLRLKYSTMRIGKLTEEDLTIFVKLWQCSEIRTCFEQMTWNLDNSENFNIQKLAGYLRGLRKNKNGWFEINHFNDSKKRILIFVKQESLTFEWSYDEEVSICDKN